MRRTFFITVALIIAAAAIVAGQSQKSEITVQAKVDLPQAMVGDVVTLTVSVAGANLPDGISPDVLGINAEGLQVISQNQRRSITSGSSFTLVINGKTIRRDEDAEVIVITEYAIRATRPGNFQLGPAKVFIRGKTYESGKVGFSVSTVPHSPDGLEPRGTAFVQMEVTPKRAYVGQQISLKFFLYVKKGIGIEQLAQYELPRLDGFIKSEFEPPGKYSVRHRAFGEIIYQEIYLGRLLLFPINTGTRTLTPMKQGYIERVKVNDHPFFGSQYRHHEKEAKSQPVQMEILPLPVQGRPADFSGAVGRFNLQVDADKNQIRAGETITFTAELTGTGNLESALDPNMNLPDTVQAYPPEKEDASHMVGDDLQSRRSLKYILVPQQEGKIKLGPVTFTYFDPIAGAYRTARSRPITVDVLAGVISAGPKSIALPETQEVRSLGTDIRYIKPDSKNLRDRSRPFYTMTWYWALHAFPLVLLAGAALARRRQDKLLTDRGFARRVGAKTTAKKRFTKAQNMIDDGDPSAFYMELSGALLGFIADHLDLMAAGLTSKELTGKMKDARVPDDLIEQTNTLLNKSDAARYAPSTLSAAVRADDLEKTKDLITRLGKIFEGVSIK